MARWIIEREAGRGNDKVFLFYHNLVTGMRYPLGSSSSDVPDQMIVDWIFKCGDPALGDQIRLSNGSVFVYQAQHRARA